MEFKIGERVVYGGSEICRIAETVKRSFDGVHEQEYYRIVPEASASASYYIPADKLGERVRSLLTKEEILEVIDSMPETEVNWSDDRNERKLIFSQALKSDDYRRLLGMMKAIYMERQRRSKNGKSLISADERALSSAEKLLHSEFSIVLGIPEDKVGEFIEKRLAEKQEQ